MVALKLAFRNLLGAGLRTWLNVTVLSFAFVVIIFYNGMLNGWDRQGKRDTQEWEVGQGQLWHPAYDKYDVFSIQEAHGPMETRVKQLISQGKLTPILIAQATAYPEGRMQGVLLKGIDPEQDILKIPSHLLKQSASDADAAADVYDTDGSYATGVHHAIIGKRMAKSLKAAEGDQMPIRWRDKNGTFDALEVKIAAVFKSDVPAIDNGQIYLSLQTLQQMMGIPDEATLLVSGTEEINGNIGNWVYKDLNFLFKELDDIILSKRAGSLIMQSTLLLIALLAIFDTQILSIFRRQKEIGTYIALGMTRAQVVGIFTVEGGAHSILAALVGAIYGIPLFMWLAAKGITFGVDDMGITMAETIFPFYSLGLIVFTTLFVIAAATIVSYIPARKISKMNPTDALRGKVN
jgi:putative ABC transport system permease protein